MRYMKAIKMILGFTVVMSVIVAIMLAPGMILAFSGASQTIFLIFLLPCSAFGFLIGFSIMCKVLDTGKFDKLLD